MRILVLEDSIARLNYFIERYGSHDLTIIENATNAIGLLEENTYDVIFLDNDLGDDNGEGIDVVKYLYENSYNDNNSSSIVIHSWNTAAVKAMANLLPQAYVMPFASEEFLNIRLDNE